MSNETHEGRWSTVTGHKAEPYRVQLRVYTYTREGRIISTSTLGLTRKEVKALLAQMERAADEQEQYTLPWVTEGDDNVRWLPPQP